MNKTPLTLEIGLPLRLVKRRLLTEAALPLDKTITSFVVPEDIEAIILHAQSSRPCFLVISVPGPYRVPPFFQISADGEIRRRSIDAEPAPRDIAELRQELEKLPANSVVDVTAPLWGDGVLAARVMIVNEREQRLEASLGVLPRDIGTAADAPYLAWILCRLRPTATMSVRGPRRLELYRLALSLLGDLSPGFDGMLHLTRLAPLPTLELAYVPARGPVIVDVDWPNQWFLA